MWKITTRGLTLQEVLIMAAMNVVTRPDSDQQRRRTNWGSHAHRDSLDIGDCHGKSNRVLHTEELSEAVKDSGSVATRKNHRVLLTDEEIGLAAIHLLRMERKYEVHSHTNRLYASGRFRETVASHLPKLSQPGAVSFRATSGTDSPRHERILERREQVSPLVTL